MAGSHLGLRISEILALQVRHFMDGIQPKHEMVLSRRHIKGGKGSRTRVRNRIISIHPDLAAAVAAHVHEFPCSVTPYTYLFPSRKGVNRPISRIHAWRILKEAAQSAGVPAERVSTHSLRKGFAHAVYEASGHDLLATKELLGHANIETTIKYLENDRSRLSEIVRGLHLSAPMKPERAVVAH